MKKNTHIFSLVLLLFTYMIAPVTGIAQTQEVINQNSIQTTSPLNEEENEEEQVIEGNPNKGSDSSNPKQKKMIKAH